MFWYVDWVQAGQAGFGVETGEAGWVAGLAGHKGGVVVLEIRTVNNALPRLWDHPLSAGDAVVGRPEAIEAGVGAVEALSAQDVLTRLTFISANSVVSQDALLAAGAVGLHHVACLAGRAAGLANFLGPLKGSRRAGIVAVLPERRGGDDSVADLDTLPLVVDEGLSAAVAVVRSPNAGEAAIAAGLTDPPLLDGPPGTDSFTGLQGGRVRVEVVVGQAFGAVCGRHAAKTARRFAGSTDRHPVAVLIAYHSVPALAKALSPLQEVALLAATAGRPAEALRAKLYARLANSVVFVEAVAALAETLPPRQDQRGHAGQAPLFITLLASLLASLALPTPLFVEVPGPA